MRVKLIVVIIVAGILSALAGCSCIAPSSLTSPVGISPLSTAESPLTVPTVVFPTSHPGLATITGVILRAGTKTSIQDELYLSEALETTDPEQMWVGVDKAIDPRAALDTNTGAFAFYDVSPGTYALVIMHPLSTPVLVDDPETGETMFLTVEVDDNVDLGTILVNAP